LASPLLPPPHPRSTIRREDLILLIDDELMEAP
jgi:hypothetical protein